MAAHDLCQFLILYLVYLDMNSMEYEIHLAMLISFLSISQISDELLVDRKWRNALHEAETALRVTQLALSTAALPARGSLLTQFARPLTTKILVNRLIRRNTRGS